MTRFLTRCALPAVVIAMLATASAAFAQAPFAPAEPISLTSGGVQPAQGAPQKTYPAVMPETTPFPVDVERVKAHAGQIPAVKFSDTQLRFYATVIAEQQSFFDKFAKNYDWMNGPTRGGAPMTYNEFVNMVTPKDLDLLFSSSNSGTFAMLQAAAMNAAGQALIKKAIQKVHDAHSAAEIQAIRQQIERELAALSKENRP